jgi:hypothetical protein
VSELLPIGRCQRCNHRLEDHGPEGCESRVHMTEKYGDTGCGCYDFPAREILVDVTPPAGASPALRNAVADWLEQTYNQQDTWRDGETAYWWQEEANELLALLRSMDSQGQ